VRSGDGVTDWLGRIEELTADHRAERAAELGRRRTKRRLELRKDGYSDEAIHRASKWYDQRARGHRKRIEHVRECGAKVLRISCQACGLAHDRVAGCRVRLLCQPCRRLTLAEMRAAFGRARAEVLAAALRRGLLLPFRRGGRFSEKFLTLTAPHVSGDTIRGRIVRVLEAWRRFLKRLNRFLKKCDAKSAEWFRAFEWTAGFSDDAGHPHLHVWIFGPFLPAQELRDWWCFSLIEAGCPQHLAARRIVDLGEVQGQDGAARELIKYLTKDVTSAGELLAPEQYAEVYKALDGRRVLQASRGFMGLAKRAQSACDCGARLPKQVRCIPTSETSEKTTVPKGSST
jgi:hypothetical protein